MKKFFLITMLLVSTAFCLFAQESLSDEKASSINLQFLNLDENFLLTVPDYFSKYEYQNRAGDLFSHKDVKEMLLGVPENEKLMKQYNGFMVATYSLLGVFLASAAVDMVYTFNENLPYRNTVNNITNYVSLMSFCGVVITGSAGKLKFKRAVDNYNYSLLQGK